MFIRNYNFTDFIEICNQKNKLNRLENLSHEK